MLTHACEAWDLTEDIRRLLNGFNSHCLHTSTKRPHRATATNPEYNLVLVKRKRRLRYAEYILCMDPNRLLRHTLAVYVSGGSSVPGGGLLQDCAGPLFEDLAKTRKRQKSVKSTCQQTQLS